MTNQDQHDESLANLLIALASTDPDPGFSQRMVRGVESRQAAAAAPSRRRRLVWALTFATATASALILFAARTHQHPHPGQQAGAIAPTPSLFPTQIAAPTRNLVVLSEVRGAPSADAVEGSASILRHKAAAVTIDIPKTEAELDPSQAKSFPAPPMPLTEQEKLLIRIAHTGDPVEFAALNAEKRKRAEAIYEEAYVKAFPPGLSAEAEDALVLKISKGEIQ